MMMIETIFNKRNYVTAKVVQHHRCDDAKLFSKFSCLSRLQRFEAKFLILIPENLQEIKLTLIFSCLNISSHPDELYY